MRCALEFDVKYAINHIKKRLLLSLSLILLSYIHCSNHCVEQSNDANNRNITEALYLLLSTTALVLQYILLSELYSRPVVVVAVVVYLVLLGHSGGGQLDDVHQLLEQTSGQTAVHHHLHTKIGSWSVSNRSIIWQKQIIYLIDDGFWHEVVDIEQDVVALCAHAAVAKQWVD